jgi:uncharacterized protein YdhG (YjbR/CyaY superfamily)
MRKSNSPPANIVDDYLANVPEPALATLTKIRATIRSVMPEGSTEGISYGMPMFKYKGIVCGYAAFADHCSLFPTPGVIEKFQDELQGFELSKGTIRFAVNKPPSAALIKRMVKARLAEL